MLLCSACNRRTTNALYGDDDDDEQVRFICSAASRICRLIGAVRRADVQPMPQPKSALTDFDQQLYSRAKALVCRSPSPRNPCKNVDYNSQTPKGVKAELG